MSTVDSRILPTRAMRHGARPGSRRWKASREAHICCVSAAAQLATIDSNSSGFSDQIGVL